MDREARNDALAGITILVIVAIFGSVTGEIFIDPLDPGFSSQDFPIGVLGLMTILALSMLGRSVAHLAKSGWQLYEAGEAGPVLRHLLPTVALGFLYVWMLEQFQYMLPTLLVLSISMWMFGNRGVGRLLVAPVIVTVIFYVLFYGIFGLNEAPGVLLEYENAWYFRPLRQFLGFAY